jgi:hypothetical protein
MSLSIGDKSIEYVKVKGHSYLKTIDSQTLDKELVGLNRTFTKTNTTIEDMFSSQGLTVSHINLKAIGSYSALTVRLFNLKTNDLTFISNAELIKGVYLNNDKLSSQIKNILFKLCAKLEANNKASVIDQHKQQFNQHITPKKAIFVLSVMCPMKPENEKVIPITVCFLCDKSNMTNKAELLVKYHEFNRVNKVKVINEIQHFNAFIATLSSKEKDILKTIYCRLNQ